MTRSAWAGGPAIPLYRCTACDNRVATPTPDGACPLYRPDRTPCHGVLELDNVAPMTRTDPLIGRVHGVCHDCGLRADSGICADCLMQRGA